MTSIIIKIRKHQHHASSLSFTMLKGKKFFKKAKRYATLWSTLVSLSYRGPSLIHLGSESRVPGSSASLLALRYMCVNSFLKNHITTQPCSAGVSRVGVCMSEVCTVPPTEFNVRPGLSLFAYPSVLLPSQRRQLRVDMPARLPAS